MNFKNNYYANAFIWSTLQKVLSAIVGFVSIPLLLGYYGKADYGLLSIATACNGYMNLLDLGMNTGAVRYFSMWRTEGLNEKISRVARTNITFYGYIALINILALILLSIYGEPVFSITHEQFIKLRYCLYILALFSFTNWLTTAFNQLLISDKQLTFTIQIQFIATLFKCLLICCVFLFDLSLISYFFWMTAIVSLIIVPYAIKCRKDNLIDSVLPAKYWREFKPVFVFSLSIFALSLFQMTATQSRPIIISMFAEDGAGAVADFQIISVVPQLIIMIGGTFSSIFLPKTSEIVVAGDQHDISNFSYKWTTRTSIILNILCIPFVICANDFLCAYVGGEYSYLKNWLILWCFTVLIQMHTTPTNALILAYGKTKPLVVSTAIFCIISVLLNAILCKYYLVGSAVIAYGLYVVFVIGLYYLYYYKTLLHLNSLKIMLCFLKPTFWSIIIMIAVMKLPISISILPDMNERIGYFIICIFKTCLWIVPYLGIIRLLKIEGLKSRK